MRQTKLVKCTQELGLVDKVSGYLIKTKADLISAPKGLDLSYEISSSGNEWVYHLKDTTLVAKISPLEKWTLIEFATAGKHAKKVLGDLKNILDQY